MSKFVEQDFQEERNYVKLLSIVSKLSGLFSDSTIPYINYRVVENVFCKCFNADNLSRSDVAFDAKIGNLGIGLKTFMCPSQQSLEKVAEFNSLSRELSQYQGLDLARQLAYSRNERISLARRLYGIQDSIYHIVARRAHQLIFFETDYAPIDIEQIRVNKSTSSSLNFSDGQNEYSFMHSKSTLFRRFILPESAKSIDIEILNDPYQLLLSWDREFIQTPISTFIAGKDFVVLPLYSTINKNKEVPSHSGLNQWNAKGRARDYGEIYIPVPKKIHNYCPNFFPPRDTTFRLQTPKGEVFCAKLCQDGSKALMTNPNRALSDWLLRELFQLREGELLTRERMNLLGFDSVLIQRNQNEMYSIEIQPLGAYENFLNEIESTR